VKIMGRRKKKSSDALDRFDLEQLKTALRMDKKRKQDYIS